MQSFRLLKSIWQITAELIRRHPVLVLPFLIIGLCDAGMLALCFFSPREVLAPMLAPPIRAFWGEQYLHYPANFYILPKLYEYGHLFVGACVGVVMMSTAVGMIAQANRGELPAFWWNVFRAIRRFFSIFWVWFIGLLLVMLAVKGSRLLTFMVYDTAFKVVLPPRAMALVVVQWVSFFGALVLEALWVYAIPVVMLEGKRWWRSIWTSVRMTVPIFGATYLLVLCPTSLLLSVIVLKQQAYSVMQLTEPEAMLVVLGLGVVYSAVVDWAVVSSATVMYVLQRESASDGVDKGPGKLPEAQPTAV